MNRQVLFILSVKAGNGKSLRLSRRIEELYKQAGRKDQVSILVTEHGNHAFEAARMFADRHGANGIVFVCGGDGSTSEVANALVHTETAMGVLPLGTANDFAKMLYSKKDAADLDGLLSRTLTPVICPIDLIRINDRYAINIVSFGYDTVVLKNAYIIMRKFPFVGSAGYALGVLKSLFSRKSFDVKVIWTDENGQEHHLDRPLVLGVICNGGYYGNGFNPAPMAKTDDGILHYVFVDTMKSFGRFVSLILRYKKGKHIGDNKVHVGPVVRGIIRPKQKGELILGNSDGIIFEESQVNVEIAPLALQFAYI